MASRQIVIAPPITEQVIAYLKHQLQQGDLLPGQRISEVELAQKLGISRSPIREALQRLVNEGLVILIPNKGAHVATFTLAELRELYEVREALEGMAARLAGARATDEEIAELEELLIRTATELEPSETTAYPSTLDFHYQLAAMADNAKLADKISEISVQIRLGRSLSGAAPKRAAEAYREHIAILETIRIHDSAGAEVAMRQHIVKSRDKVLAIFQTKVTQSRDT